ncbi:50S ribosome-binding GTPase [Desertifilum sp. FACHB-1129]|uniref:G domain-containing protein n=1 Tax=Desertifilum tharense IPPAS B-1220 TaxID=1781255 RepID=A0A1E5QNX0_9CYAN|nr:MULTISPECIES: GTPase [Desertifilum]MDA0209388.1 50S ribosome-binding GTPase [Cyanobacteria bacterium FC1]MBD2311662.1 50S ribosome-binding GTPase [Desertifilum sp. FACHB-1129]MBD2322813.1 50S ribosome-binding GTPase [Desertifilum sp. FACHB-866]MBD2332793.1 50S ribosome-binding GTPase [Desertifilum sp. FACHB-868]OEJ76349.1 hypothetical protein BH720_04910 [Desertifilum tharense IPPAS B-1220]
MSDQAIDTLKLIFQDQPGLLEIIQLGGIESEQLLNTFRKQELFTTPINLYVTGRTGSGKTSLGNRLLNQSIMNSTGYQDCTDKVGFFKLASNLCYFDLPGAGSDEEYENINRAALLMDQRIDEDLGKAPVSSFEVATYGNQGQIKEEGVEVSDWQSEKSQRTIAPDVILYVIAPHTQFLRCDSQYLASLLKSQKKRTDKNKAIFALNIFQREGRVLSTPQNIADVRKKVTEIYQKHYPAEEPFIVEFNALTGDGINEITSNICKILPKSKLGNIEQVLRDDLKQFAERERRDRYLKNLIRIVSRLATYKVDQKAGDRDLIQTATSAIVTYGVKTFQNLDKLEKIKSDIDLEINLITAKLKEERQRLITINENKTESKDITREVPKFEEVTVTDWIVVNEVRVKSVSGLKKFTNIITGFFGIKFFDDKFINETVRKPIERIETRLAGYETEVIGTIEAVVGQVEKVIGQEYLKGGYSVIKSLLAIGLGTQAYCNEENANFQSCVDRAEARLEHCLNSLQSKIEYWVDTEDARTAEHNLIQLLETTLS